MKGFIKATSLLTICVLNLGCTSTEENSSTSKIVRYESRCDTQSKTSEENVNDSSHAKLLATKTPKYPIEAIRKKQEGYVKIEFDISEEGKPININVIETLPAKVFDQAAIFSFRGWRYEPKASSCNTVQLDFKFG